MLSAIKNSDWFREWRDPQEYLDASRLSMIEIRKKEILPNGRHQLFLQNNWKYLLEVWASGMFASIASVKNKIRVRLGEGDQSPDFYIEHKNSVLDFELTECDLIGRKRGNEYRNVRNRQELVCLDNPDALFDDSHHIRQQLPMAVQKKCEKHYNPKRNLLIYINVGMDGQEKPPIPDHELQVMTKSASTEFNSTWLLWENYIMQTWPKWNWLRAQV